MENTIAVSTKQHSKTQDILSDQQINPFDKLKIAGAWRVKIKRGDQYHVQVTAAPEIKQFLYVKSKNGVLHLQIINHPEHAWSNIHCTAEITTPKLNSISLSGAANVAFDGFQSESFVVEATGASAVYGKNNIFNDLGLKGTGASKFELTDTDVVKSLNLEGTGASRFNLFKAKVKDANVKISGASRVELNMTGGALTGELSGASKIIYTGTISKYAVNTFGSSSVSSVN
ncbi:MAG: hypothetical protein ACD_21C00133G0001 [uncultured bacterium]|nr:MAG: hypothetical protein ACD_21C00133G0001 [uncultured bacterium]